MVSRMDDVRWQGHLHKHYSPDPAVRKLSMYTVKGVPQEAAHVRQDTPRGPWIIHVVGEDISTEHYKSDAQREVEALLAIGWRNRPESE